jgi:hypothetical protein
MAGTGVPFSMGIAAVLDLLAGTAGNRPTADRQPTDSDPSHDELDMAGRRALRDRR